MGPRRTTIWTCSARCVRRACLPQAWRPRRVPWCPGTCCAWPRWKARAPSGWATTSAASFPASGPTCAASMCVCREPGRRTTCPRPSCTRRRRTRSRTRGWRDVIYLRKVRFVSWMNPPCSSVPKPGACESTPAWRMRPMTSSSLNVDPAEIARFEAAASRWWDPQGEMRPLHDLNPVRLQYVERAGGLAGRKVIDVGCGGGLLAEAMARKGAEVTALDLADDLLQVAKLHALESGVDVDYLLEPAEAH